MRTKKIYGNESVQRHKTELIYLSEDSASRLRGRLVEIQNDKHLNQKITERGVTHNAIRKYRTRQPQRVQPDVHNSVKGYASRYKRSQQGLCEAENDGQRTTADC